MTDATVAARIPNIVLRDRAGNIVLRSWPSSTQAASTTFDYFAQAIGENVGSPGPSNRNLLIPANFWMPQGFRLETATVLLQAGDQFSNIFLFFEVWPG